MRVLAIESSCDDTSVAVVSDDGSVQALRSLAQDQFHAKFGGIVPEVAGRNHSIKILPIIDETLKEAKLSPQELDGIAVTNRPGLIGSLIVGLVTAKTFSQVLGKPLIGVNHLEGHILAPFLKDKDYSPSFSVDSEFLALAVSGGHTSLYLVSEVGKYQVLGKTLDDAAGEAFDKFAKMLGLTFPGGPQVDLLAKGGDVKAFAFPRSMILEDTYDFSFSGLKSSAARLISNFNQEQRLEHRQNLCASFQEAIVDVLLHRMGQASKEFGINKLVITGGVSANSRLRARAEQLAQRQKWQLLIPPMRYCTDNAAMIGYAGVLRLAKGERHGLDLGPSPQSWATDFV